QSRLLEPLAAHHHGPGHACNLVSKRNSRDLDRPPVHETREPEPLRAVLARISDDGHRASDEQPAQMSIALLGDPAEPLFAVRAAHSTASFALRSMTRLPSLKKLTSELAHSRNHAIQALPICSLGFGQMFSGLVTN